MIFLQVSDSLQKIEEIVKKAEDIIKKADEIAKEPTLMEHIVGVLDIIIWPVTLIVSLYLFKKQIGRVIDRFESADVSPTGVAIKLKNATKLIGDGSSAILPKSGGTIIAKDGGTISPKDESRSTAKSEENVTQNRSHAESPYQELMELQDAINQKLTRIATQKGIQSTGGYSNFALTSDLANRDVLDKHASSKLKALIELNTLGLNSPEITHEQVTQMKRLFNNISL